MLHSKRDKTNHLFILFTNQTPTFLFFQREGKNGNIKESWEELSNIYEIVLNMLTYL